MLTMRDPLVQAKRDVRVAILGGGLMGHALAAVFLANGCRTCVYEQDATTRANLIPRIKTLLDGWKGTLHESEELVVVDSINDLNASTDLVIEAIPENLAWKQQLFAEVEPVVPHAVLATNSSVYRVADVSAKMSDPSRAIGTHWWNPPHLVPIVEVVQSQSSRLSSVNWVIDFLKECGKTPVHVRKDTPGFIGNRLQHALWREAFALVEEGIADAATVDLVVCNTIGLKLGLLGPLENADYVGLDMTFAIHEYLFPVLSGSRKPLDLLTGLVQQGELGAKTGRGLLAWPEGKARELADRLSAHIREQTMPSESSE